MLEIFSSSFVQVGYYLETKWYLKALSIWNWLVLYYRNLFYESQLVDQWEHWDYQGDYQNFQSAMWIKFYFYINIDVQFYFCAWFRI